MLGIVDDIAQEFDFFFEQITATLVFAKERHHRRHRRMRTVTRAKCIVDIDIGERRERLGKLLLRLFECLFGSRFFFVAIELAARFALFFFVKSQVLEQQNLTRFEALRLLDDAIANAIFCKNDFAFRQQFRQSFRHGLKRKFRARIRLRTPQVRRHNGQATIANDVLNRRYRLANAEIIRYHAIIERYVKIDANKHALAI